MWKVLPIIAISISFLAMEIIYPDFARMVHRVVVSDIVGYIFLIMIVCCILGAKHNGENLWMGYFRRLSMRLSASKQRKCILVI